MTESDDATVIRTAHTDDDAREPLWRDEVIECLRSIASSLEKLVQVYVR